MQPLRSERRGEAELTEGSSMNTWLTRIQDLSFVIFFAAQPAKKVTKRIFFGGRLRFNKFGKGQNQISGDPY